MELELNSSKAELLVLDCQQRPFATECLNAVMTASVDAKWNERLISLDNLPNEMPTFRWYNDEEWAHVRDNPQGYWCHDAALLRRSDAGLEVMVCVRSLTGSRSNSVEVHSSPIEGWLWFPGGRNKYDCSPTREFNPAAPTPNDLASLLDVLRVETKLQRSDCLSAWNLGVGKTFFPEVDIYRRTEWGVEFQMRNPQRTHNAIYVVEVVAEFTPICRGVEHPIWISQTDFIKLKQEFCPYMQQCLSAIFNGADITP